MYLARMLKKTRTNTSLHSMWEVETDRSAVSFGRSKVRLTVAYLFFLPISAVVRLNVSFIDLQEVKVMHLKF